VLTSPTEDFCYEFINPLMNFSASAAFAPFLISEMALESFAYMSFQGVVRPFSISL